MSKKRQAKNVQPALQQHNVSGSTYSCTQCGGNAEIGYSNWSRAGVKEKIVGKNERLCRKCFKQRTGQAIF